MPVAEAAVVLGVSERTIWRRIKSDTIDTRSENGRTLVHIEEPEPAADPVRQLSNVAAAQLSMRKLDADNISDVLTVLTDYRASFDKEMTRTRRGTRFAWFVAAVLLLAATASVLYHREKLTNLRLAHITEIDNLKTNNSTALDDLEVEYEQALAQLRETQAHAIGLSEAQTEEIQELRRKENNHEQKLIAVEAAREEMSETMDKRVDAFQKTVTAQQAAAQDREKKIANLEQTVADLKAQLVTKERVNQKIKGHHSKIVESIRRSAARSIGMAEGLRMQVASQQKQLEKAWNELDTIKTSSPEKLNNKKLRENLLKSVTGVEYSLADQTEEPVWQTILKKWVEISFDPAATTQTEREIAQAD